MPSKSAKAMQAKSEATPLPKEEERLATTLRTDNGYEYHLELARSVVTALLDPDTDDCFIEVPCAVNGVRRFIHTAYIKEIDARGL